MFDDEAPIFYYPSLQRRQLASERLIKASTHAIGGHLIIGPDSSLQGRFSFSLAHTCAPLHINMHTHIRFVLIDAYFLRYLSPSPSLAQSHQVAGIYLQFEDEDHFRAGLEDLVERDEPRAVGGSVQHRDLVQGLGSQLLGASALPQELGGPLAAARPLAASSYRRVLAPESITCTFSRSVRRYRRTL
jgi:hypothetical protein